MQSLELQVFLWESSVLLSDGPAPQSAPPSWQLRERSEVRFTARINPGKHMIENNERERRMVRLTRHQQQPLSFGLHLRTFPVFFIRAAVERLTGLMNDRLLQVHLAGHDLQKRHGQDICSSPF